MEQLASVHPGDVLREDFLVPLGITAYRLAQRLHMPQTAVGEILAGKRAITPATALKLERLLGSSAEFWLNLQAAYDLEEERRRAGEKLALIEPWELDEEWRQRREQLEPRRAALHAQLPAVAGEIEAELAQIEPYEATGDAVAA
jgi:antitoxin HigA-1